MITIRYIAKILGVSHSTVSRSLNDSFEISQKTKERKKIVKIYYKFRREIIVFEFNLNEVKWFCKPKKFNFGSDSIEIFTEPNTDLWQKTYYGFQNDNAHILYVTTREKYFSFTVKTNFEYSELFDQCGISIYQNSNSWVKAGIEFHDNNTSWLGSVVTNNGYSDWATTEVGTNIKSMWYRVSRRESDFLLENSSDGEKFNQMRIFHLVEANDSINIGLLACSPKESSFKAVFSNIKITDCLWEKH